MQQWLCQIGPQRLGSLFDFAGDLCIEDGTFDFVGKR
jgi:hypothetical protein